MPTAESNLAEICYSKTFLKAVILRIDFPAPIADFALTLPPLLSKAALKHFPIQEAKRNAGQVVEISQTAVKSKEVEEMHWLFHGRDREKTLTIAPQFIVGSYRTYTRYAALKEEMFSVLGVLFELHPSLVASRIGLRFVNEIALEGQNPREWSDYVHNEMLGSLRFAATSPALVRALNTLEFNFGDMQLRYQFGMHNPDFPSEIRKKVFLLDLDAYYRGPTERVEVDQVVDRAQKHIQELFERSITDRLRELMR